MADELMQALARLRREEHAADSSAEALTEPTRERVLAGMFERLDAESASGHDQAPAQVVSLASRRWVTVLGAVLAAALLLVLLRPSSDALTLPSYTITRADGGDAKVRSGPGELLLHLRLTTPRDAIDVVVTPATATRTAVDVTLVARTPDGVVVRSVVTEHVEHAPQGAIRLRAPLDRFIALGVGTWRIDVVISPVGTVIDAGSKHPWPIATLQVTIDAP